jgi:hypothetical protein
MIGVPATRLYQSNVEHFPIVNLCDKRVCRGAERPLHTLLSLLFPHSPKIVVYSRAARKWSERTREIVLRLRMMARRE